MDFLVVGLGLGALAILSGIVMVTLVVWRSQRAARSARRPEDQRYYQAAATSQDAAGQALLAAGAAILLATVGAVAGSLDDRTGSLLVATTATVAAIGLLVRDFLYRARNPRPRRPRVRSLETPVAASPTRTAPLASAPLEDMSRSIDQEQKRDEEPESGEAVAAMVAEPGRDTDEEHDAPVEQDVPVVDAEPTPVPAMVASAPEAEPEPDGIIDAPYSFMLDDDPASQARVAPYSFMTGDDRNDPGKTDDADGAEAGAGEVAIGADESLDDAPAGTNARKARPVLRLVGKGRSQAP